MLMAPILFWALAGSFAYFDGYRQGTVNLKAAYTISDLISRETAAVDDDYIDSMYNLLQLLTKAQSEVKLRISVIRYDQDDDRYYVDWSAIRGYNLPRTNGNIAEIEGQLPTMPDNERVIVIETRNKYKPIPGAGMSETTLANLVFTRPRFAPQVAWSDD
jgi:hypothetical protein